MSATENSNDPAFMLRVARTGFLNAMDRFQQATQQPNARAEACFVPITEALWWAVSLDEGYEKLQGKAYKDDRAQDVRGMKLLGVRYARNRGGHQRALVVEHHKGGLTVPIRVPIVIPGPSFRWCAVDKLPPADPGFEFPNGRKSYEDHLAGVRASETLAEGADWFAHVEQ